MGMLCFADKTIQLQSSAPSLGGCLIVNTGNFKKLQTVDPLNHSSIFSDVLTGLADQMYSDN